MKQLRAAVARPCGLPRHARESRRGGILVLSAVMLVMVFGMVAFAVDLGYISKTKTELQSAADGAALAAAIEIVDGLGKSPAKTQSQMQNAARPAAVTVAAANRNGTFSQTYVDGQSHIRFGRINWVASENNWVKTWGATPANMVEVTAHRDSSGTGSDGKLKLLFGGIVGSTKSAVKEHAVAGVLPGVGFRVAPGSTATMATLPIACDQASWNAYIANANGGATSSYTDSYSYNPNTKVVSNGGDSVRELNIYPNANGNLPSGNRGTVDLGNPNNSTADLSRQIRFGLNASDLSYFPNNTIRTDTGPVIVNGDTGISAGIKDDLEAIKGQPRLMPIFSVVGSQAQATSGNSNGKSAGGNNVYYRIEKFVGVRIVYVQLTGQNKRVLIQPATFSSSQVIRGKVADTGTGDTYYAKPGLLE